MSSPAKNQAQTPTLNSLLRQPSSIGASGQQNSNQSLAPPPQASTMASGPGGGYPGATYSPGPGTPIVDQSGPQQQQQQQQAPSSTMPQQVDPYYNHRLGMKGSNMPANNYVPDGMQHGIRYGYPTPASPFQQPPPMPPPQGPPGQMAQGPPPPQPPHGYYGGPPVDNKMYSNISGYQQPGVANGPSPHSPRTAAPVAGQLHGKQGPTTMTTVANSAIPQQRDHESMVNGIPPTKGATTTLLTGSNQTGGSDQGPPKHPSVTALRQEASSISPAGTRNASPSPVSLAAPSSPASLMRHSPVSPTPVSVYNPSGAYHGQPSVSGHYPNQQQQAQQQPPPMAQQHQHQPQHQPPHPGFYDGNYYGGGGYGHTAPGAPGPHPGPPQSQPGGSYAGYTGSTGTTSYANGPPAGPSNAPPQGYYGHPQQYPGQPMAPPNPNGPPMPPHGMPYGGGPPHPPPNTEMMPSQQAPYYGQQMKSSDPGRGTTTNGPTNPYPHGMAETSRSPAVADGSSDLNKDPNRNGSGTPSMDNTRHRTSTPATPAGKIRVNGAKESHPSTPIPASPGGASIEDVDSSLSSPSWPRTPMSPALRSQSSSMGPPASMPSSSAGGGASSKEGGGANLVARLLGDPNQLGCSPQEWNDRRGFYERLVQYCESNGHPITAQPTVSKQTVDLYRLYQAVRQKGGFEEVTRAKGWKEHCHLANLPYTSGASYQLRKHYARYLLPYECHYDRGGVQSSVVMASLENKKKTPSSSKSASKNDKTFGQQHSKDPKGDSSSASASVSQQPVVENDTSMPQPPRQMYPPPQPQSHPQQPSQQPSGQQQQQQPYPGDTSFMGPPPVPYTPGPPVDNSGTHATMPPGAAHYPNQGHHHGQPPTPGQYPHGGGPPAPYMQMPAHQRPAGGASEQMDHERSSTAAPSQQQQQPYYPQQPPVGASPSSGAYNQQPKPPPSAYPTSAGYHPSQMASTASSSADTSAASRMPQAVPTSSATPSDGHPTPSQSYPGTPGGPPPVATSTPASTSAYGANQMASPNGPGGAYHQSVAQPQYPQQQQHEPSAPATANAPPPPNQYITPQGPRYQHPGPSAAPADGSQAPGMISHVYRSNVPPATPYGQGMFVASGAQPSAHKTAPYMQQQSQQQQVENQTNQTAQSHYSQPPTAEAYNVQPGAPYSWSGQQRYPHPMPQRFPGAQGYPPSTSMAQNMDYSRMSRAGQAPFRPNVAGYPPGPSAPTPPYGNGPPNMSLRADLGMKSLPTGSAPHYMQQTAAMPQAAAIRKEVSPVSAFPPGSVESTTFSMRRRRKLTAKDAGSVEAWRLVMALRSGLQAETTWALNSLNILLYDDHSALFFGLANLPGLLETLIEHWRRSLMDILGDVFVIEEVECHRSTTSESQQSTASSSDSEHHHPSLKRSRSMTGTNSGSVISYESGLWHRGGGANTQHLKFRTDLPCDEYFLTYGVSTATNSDKSERWSRRKRSGRDEDERSASMEQSAKRNRSSSSTMDTDAASTSSSSQATTATVPFFFANRRYEESDEIELHNNLPLQTVPMTWRQRMDRCTAISNIIRGLSFIPGNEAVMSKHAGLLRVLAELLLMCHKHVDRSNGMKCNNDHHHQQQPQADEIGEATKTDIDSALGNGIGGDESQQQQHTFADMDDPLWYWDNILSIVDDAFVVLCNLSTHLDLYERHERVSLRLLDALLHWAVCRSPVANDPLVNGAYVSPHRYAIEILCKLSVQERNVDLMLATPPWERVEYLLDSLSSMLMMSEDIMMREFAVVLVHALVSASQVACAAAALRTKALQQLIIFLEQADANMHQVVQNHGMQALRDNPELIGTSVGMLRRAASSLLSIAKLPACHSKFNRYQQRLLHFTMSHLMDSRVAATVAEALYELQKGGGEAMLMIPTAIASSAVKINETPRIEKDQSESKETNCVGGEENLEAAAATASATAADPKVIASEADSEEKTATTSSIEPTTTTTIIPNGTTTLAPAETKSADIPESIAIVDQSRKSSDSDNVQSSNVNGEILFDKTESMDVDEQKATMNDSASSITTAIQKSQEPAIRMEESSSNGQVTA